MAEDHLHLIVASVLASPIDWREQKRQRRVNLMRQLFARLRKGRTAKDLALPVSTPPAGYYCPQSAAGLLSTEERARTLVRIWENTSLPKDTYQTLCLAPLQACAEVMQQFPYSDAGRFAYPGGMLDATLKTLLYAVMKARSYMLPPGVPPEDQARDSAAWNTVVFYAALFSHLSVLGSLKVELVDGSVWIPFDGQPASAYRFRFVPPGMAGADICLGGLFAARVLPGDVFSWLKQHPPALDMLMLWIGGQRAQCGVINAIVSDAIHEVTGSAPVQQVVPASGAAPVVGATMPVSSAPLPVDSVQETPPAMSAVTAPLVLASALEPSAGSVSVPDVAVTEAPLPEPEIHMDEAAGNTDWEDVAAFLGYEEAAQGLAVKNAGVAAPESSPDTASQGERFWLWLLKSVEDGSLAVNTPEARVHLVAGSVFIQAPAIFHQFAAENEDVDEIDSLRQDVEALPHIRRREGKLYRCRLYEADSAGGGFTNLSGYFIDARRVYGQTPVPADNPLMVVPKRR